VRILDENKESIIISDSYPYRGIYINRKNLFEGCLNKEPYHCKLNIEVTGNNIPFSILIRDAQDSTSASYLPPNEMILGISESFHPLYFYTDIKKNSEGEIFINYKKGVSRVFVNINNKTEDINDINKWGNNFDRNKVIEYNNNRIIINSSNSNCPNGCELYIGVYIVDKEIDSPDDFSLFFKYTDNNQSPIYILPNEFVFGELNQNKFDNYQILIQKDIKDVEFILECDFCKLKINDIEEYSGLDKLYKYPQSISPISLENQILNIKISPDNSLSYPQFYSFKLIIPYNKNIRRITSENIEYCNSNSCLFAIPIKNYENTNKIFIYLSNNDYPSTFSPTLKTSLVDYNIIESSDDLSPSTSLNINNNIYTQSIDNDNKDKYLVIELNNTLGGLTSLTTSKYPHLLNKTLIPNSNYLIHSESKNNITFNLYGNTLQFIEFININNGGPIKYLNDEEYLISKGNFEYNIPNNEASFTYNGGENSDILIRYKTSPNDKLNIHYLDLSINTTLKYNTLNTGINSNILIFFKLPKDMNSNSLNFNLTFSSNNLVNINNIEIGGGSEQNYYNELSSKISSFSEKGKKLIKNKIYTLSLSKTNIDSLLKNNSKYGFIRILNENSFYPIEILINSSYGEIPEGEGEEGEEEGKGEHEEEEEERVIEDGDLTNYTDKITIYNLNETNSSEAQKHSTYYPIRTLFYNKTTAYNLMTSTNSPIKAVRISFLYIPGYKILYTNVSSDNEIGENLNENITMNNNSKLLSYRNRRTYIFDMTNLSINILRFYFIPQSYKQSRFLKERILNDLSTTTEFKYEIKDNISEFPVYNLTSSDLTVNEENDNYIITVNPINNITNNNSLLNENIYKLKLYKKDRVTESEIDSALNKPKPDKTYDSKINNSLITFFINSTLISSGYYYLEVTAITEDYQIIDYNLLSYPLINKLDGGIKYDDVKVIQEEKKKKPKWWIALIVIGIIIIIALIVFVVTKFSKKNKTNEDYESLRKKDESQRSKEING
jgi:hypothetical protein